MVLMAKDHSEPSMIKKPVLPEVLIADHSEKEKMLHFFQEQSLFLKTARQQHR